LGAVVFMAIATVVTAAGCGPSLATPPTIYVTDSPGPGATPADTSPADTSPAETSLATQGPTPTDAPTATYLPTATPSGPTASPTALPHAATITSTTVSQSGSSPQCGVWRVTFKQPVVADVPKAQAINVAIGSKIAGYISDFKAQLSEGGGAGSCFLTGDFSVGLNSTTLLSFGITMDEYLGGASNEALAGSLDFGAADGAVIALTDLFTSESGGAAALSTASRTGLEALLGSSADVGWIETGTTAAMSNFAAAWVLTAGGLRITFPALQVSSAADGTPTITVPWASIKGVIKAGGPAGQFAH
jgi:hypothetical protein